MYFRTLTYSCQITVGNCASNIVPVADVLPACAVRKRRLRVLVILERKKKRKKKEKGDQLLSGIFMV